MVDTQKEISDILTLQYPCSIFILGSKNSGKTTILANIIKFYSKPIKNIYIYTSTGHQDIYIKISEDPRVEIFNNLPTKEELDIIISKKDENDNYTQKLIVFDDYYAEINNNKNYNYINDIYTKGRHFNCSICEISQVIFTLNMSKRLNIDYIFLCRFNNMRAIKTFFNQIYDNPSLLLEAYKKCIKKNNNHGFLLIDNKTNNNLLRFRCSSLDEVFTNL